MLEAATSGPSTWSRVISFSSTGNWTNAAAKATYIRAPLVMRSMEREKIIYMEDVKYVEDAAEAEPVGE